MQQERADRNPPGALVVGYDGTKESDRALEHALAEAALRKAPVVVVVVAAMRNDWVDPTDPAMSIVPVEPIPEEGPREIQPYLRYARQRLQEVGAAGEVEWGLGDPATEIVRVANEHQASAIVVGAHHHTALGRLFGTDTAAQVGRDAHCDVILAH